MKEIEGVENTIRVLMSTLPAARRARIVQENAPPPAAQDRIIRRVEAAHLLARSPRAVDYIVASGALPRVTFPGHQRAAGFRLSDVQALIGGSV